MSENTAVWGVYLQAGETVNPHGDRLMKTWALELETTAAEYCARWNRQASPDEHFYLRLIEPRQEQAERDTYTVEPGRNIYRNGEPLIAIGLATKPGDPTWNPSEADDLTHVICALLNERQPKKGERS